MGFLLGRDWLIFNDGVLGGGGVRGGGAYIVSSSSLTPRAGVLSVKYEFFTAACGG